MGGPRRRHGPQRRIAGPCGSLRGGGVTEGGWWPPVDGELLRDREAVGAVVLPCTMAEGFPPERHDGTRRWTSFKVVGIDDDWHIGDGWHGEAEKCGSTKAVEEL
jgi:hypothetical protein